MRRILFTAAICATCASAANAQGYGYTYGYYQMDSVKVENFVADLKKSDLRKDWYLMVYQPMSRMHVFDKKRMAEMSSNIQQSKREIDELRGKLADAESRLKNQMDAERIQTKYDMDRLKHEKEKKALIFLLRSDRNVFEEYNPDYFTDIDDDVIMGRKESIEYVVQLDKILYEVRYKKYDIDESEGGGSKKSRYTEEFGDLVYSAESVIEGLKNSATFFSQEQKDYVNDLIKEYNGYCDLVK